MRKCAQFSIRVTFSRTLYMYIVDFPQLHRTEDLTKGFEISPNLSMSPFKLFPNVSIQVSELNPDREFMSVCCITTWNKDLKEMLQIVMIIIIIIIMSWIFTFSFGLAMALSHWVRPEPSRIFLLLLVEDNYSFY